MADRRLTTAVRVRYRLTPAWVRVVVIWALSRVVSTSLLLWFAARQPANAWTDAHPDYFSFAQLWDATWYHYVAVAGYPSELPLTDTGQVSENSWAFMPVYPFLVRALMLLTGLPWSFWSVVVSVAFSLTAALAFHRLMRVVGLPAGTALFSVALFCFAPLSPLLQVGYAEAVHLFLLIVALSFVVQRRYIALLPIIAVMALTRPSGLAFALFLGLHVIHRWWIRYRDPFPGHERIASVVAMVFSAVMGFMWLIIAWSVTGSFTAYTDTELAWRAPYIGYSELVPFAPWIQGAGWWMTAPIGFMVLALAVVAFFAFLFTPWAKRIGVDLRLWVASYGIYLLAVFFPQSSTFRLLMPMFPLVGALAQPRSRVYQVAILIVFIVGQWVWLYYCWWIDGLDWTPP